MNGNPGGSTLVSALYWVNRSSIRLHISYYPYALPYNLKFLVASIHSQTTFAGSAAILVISYAP